MKKIDNKNLSLRPGSASGELLQPRGNPCGGYGNNCGWAQKIGSCYKCLINILKILSEMSRKDISSDGQESYCRGLVKSMAEIKSTQNKICQFFLRACEKWGTAAISEWYWFLSLTMMAPVCPKLGFQLGCEEEASLLCKKKLHDHHYPSIDPSIHPSIHPSDQQLGN